MTRNRNLDHAPLARRGGLGPRLRGASTSNVVVMGGTIGILLVVVPLVVLVGLLATGNATDVGGLVLLAMCFAGGVYVLVDVLRKGADADALSRFAAANDLTLVRGSVAPHYAGSLFADESHAVHQSVRTRDDAFVEVGERFPTTAPRGSREPNRPELFLRARLAGPATRDPSELVTPELHEALSRFAGPYAIEVSGDELTLFGSRELDVVRPGRVEEAFALADELVSRASTGLVPTPTHPEPPRGRTPRPLRVVGWILALMVGGPLVIAILMSILDDHLRGAGSAARLVVSLVVLATMAVVGRLVRAAVTPRRGAERRPPE